MIFVSIGMAAFALLASLLALVFSIDWKTNEEKVAKRVSREFSQGQCCNCSCRTIVDHNLLCSKTACLKISQRIDKSLE